MCSRKPQRVLTSSNPPKWGPPRLDCEPFGGRSHDRAGNEQIAKARGVSMTTVRNAVYRIQDKPGVKSKQEIVVWAVRNGLLDEEEGKDSQQAP